MAPVPAAAPLCPPGPPNVAGLHPGAVSRGSCPAGCRVGHFVPHLPTLRPQYWRRGPLLAQTAPPRLRAGSCGSALQGRPRWPAAAAAGAPRPSPPARLGPGSLGRRRAAGRWFGASRGSPSHHAPRLSPRSASSQLRVRSDRPARRWGNRGPWEPHVRGVRSAPDSLWEGHSAPSARPRAPARWWSALSRAFSPDGAGDGEGL